MGIRHAFTSPKDDGADATLVRPSDWNADHEEAGQFSVTFDGGGLPVRAGSQTDIVTPYDGVITGWTMLADQSGSAVVDIWVEQLVDYPPTNADSITASAPPTLSSAASASSTTLDGWTTAITAGDILRFNIDTVLTVTRLVLVLDYSR